MGNRANVIFVAENGTGQTVSPVIYLHWNGGPESVYAFLAELDSRGVRADAEYDAARFVQIVGEFFDQDYHSGLSLGILPGPQAINPNHAHKQAAKALDSIQTDPGDNGFYVVERDGTGGCKVRRFTETYSRAYKRLGLKEWTTRKVREERKAALADATYIAIRAYFDQTRKPTEREYMDEKYGVKTA